MAPPVLLVAPQPDPDELQAFPCALAQGRLSVNALGCFELGEHLLLVPHGSTVSTDPLGIRVPGSDFVPVGAEVHAGAGFYSLDDLDRSTGDHRYVTPRTRGAVFAWGLRVGRMPEPERQPTRRPLP